MKKKKKEYYKKMYKKVCCLEYYLLDLNLIHVLIFKNKSYTVCNI